MVVNEVPTNEVEQAGGECISRQPVRVTSRLVAIATFGQKRPPSREAANPVTPWAMGKPRQWPRALLACWPLPSKKSHQGQESPKPSRGDG